MSDIEKKNFNHKEHKGHEEEVEFISFLFVFFVSFVVDFSSSIRRIA
ncbi:hypothetical protein AGMMS49587_02640 [Spirochaetia bacterium]|nr:hypothetical protein AGMMS49587_02640 [Spirochaetia bacterium]